MRKRVADIIMEILVEKGITDCFLVVGGGAMHLNNALALNEKIHKYFNHHEQACAMSADAYARYSGRMAAVCVTSGPGATNALTGVMGAWQDSLPMLVLSGQVRYETTIEASGLPLRYRGVQEFDIINSIHNMTKYAKMLTDPLEVKRELSKAIEIAYSGRRGPVWLDVPLDIQSAVVEEADLYPEDAMESKKVTATKEQLLFIFDKLKKAKRPCILAGNGIANSGNLKSFRNFVKNMRIPILGAAIAGDVLYREHDFYYGPTGSLSLRTGNFIIQNADVILSLGCSLGYKTTGFAQESFAPRAYMIAVDIDENEQKKPGVKVDTFIHSELADFFQQANQMEITVDADPNWIAYCNKLKQRFSPFEPGENCEPQERVNMYYFWKKYEEYESDDGVLVLGNNTANSAKLQVGIRKEAQRILANNNCGPMGMDLPAAIGTAVASGKSVTCPTGDGSIMMNLQELQTIVHYNLPVKVIVFANDGYNAIRQTCKNFFGGCQIGCTPESGVSFPKFSKLAEGFGYPYKCCHTNEELDESLKWLEELDGRGMLEVRQQLDDPVLPRVMSRQTEGGEMLSPSLEDMSPFLPKEEVETLMLW